MDDVKRILVVSRSTKHCRKAVHYGISLSKAYNSKLYVLHVFHDPFSYDGWNLPIPSFEEEYEKLVQKTRKDIDRIIKSEQADGLEITEWVRDGKPADEIFKVVEDEKIDLMIMSAHEEGRLEHYLFGRAVEELTRKMPCSIFLVNYNPLHKA
ncbi:MAG: universal stress protein [Desulfobacterales bacterium]|jgi:nucleotide-binding universal stress UspA family protein